MLLKVEVNGELWLVEEVEKFKCKEFTYVEYELIEKIKK